MTELLRARNEINRIDAELARLFCERMQAVEKVALYKKENGMAIFDEAREQEVLARCGKLCAQEEYKPYFLSFMEEIMALSRQYQQKRISGN